MAHLGAMRYAGPPTMSQSELALVLADRDKRVRALEKIKDVKRTRQVLKAEQRKKKSDSKKTPPRSRTSTAPKAMLQLELTEEMTAASERIKAGTWDKDTDVLPRGYAETAILWQLDADATRHLRMPAEIPHILICVNGRDSAVMFPEVAVTVVPHPQYAAAERKRARANGDFQPQASKKRKADNPFMQERRAAQSREASRYETDSTSRYLIGNRSRSNAPLTALEKEANARERLYNLDLDKERLRKRELDAMERAEEAAAAAAPRTRTKGAKSKNRGIDNRERNAAAAEGVAGPSGAMIGRSQICLLILVIVLIFFVL